MNTFKDRQIEYYVLSRKNYRESTNPITPFIEVEQLLKRIYKLSKKKRFYDLKSDKSCLLDLLEIQDSDNDIVIISGMVKSAVNNFRPKLINTKTAIERDNPKEKAEGEIERTHFCIKIYNQPNYKDVICIFEKNGNGISINQFVNYLNHFKKHFSTESGLKNKYSIQYQIITREDIEDAISNLSRAKIAELHIDKQLLGTDALEFSNRTCSVQRNIIVTIKAERESSIKDVALDCLKAFHLAKNKVARLRVWGETSDKQHTLIDTSLFCKKTEIKCELNAETGEVSTGKILIQMKQILNDM